MTDTAPPFALYNPALLSPEVLLSEFTARRPLLRRLLDIVRSNARGEPPQHVLLVGPRGMGKTTLLCAISASIVTREPELRQQWQPVIFDEESRRIGDLADFWLECVRQWEATTEPQLIQSPRIDSLLDRPGDDLEDRARETFLKLVDASGKRALLLIDNFNDVLSAVHDHESLMRMRSFLMADSRVMIIGAATRWFEAVSNVDKPFFEFFRGFDLSALNLEEMRECLAGVAEARGDQRVLDTLRSHPRSIEALHILTGGNPRLVRTFYRLLNEGLRTELRQQLERLIDDYTPYLKAILDALPGQQQRVLDAIALQWNPCDVATVAKLTRLPSNQVSAQIKALSKAGLVSEVPAMGTLKKKAYLLTDRFSNIHYLMRHGRAGQLRMHWFVMTLRVLFDDEQFAEHAARTVRLTASRGELTSSDAMVLANAALDCAGTEQARCYLFDRMAGGLKFDEGLDVVFAEKLCREAIVRNPNDALAWHKWGRLLDVHLMRFDEAEVAYRKAIELNPIDAGPWCNLGLLLKNHFGRHDEAEAAYRKAIELDPKDAWPWNGLGVLLTKHFGRHDEAEAAYRKAIELDPKFAWPWNNLGILLADRFGHHDEAEAAYRKAIELNPKSALPWIHLGNLLAYHLGRRDEAVRTYQAAMELDPSNPIVRCLIAERLAESGKLSEARNEAASSLKLAPNYSYAQDVFQSFCCDDASSLQATLPEVSQWCYQHPDELDVVSFLVDAWLAYAIVASSAQALKLLQAQPAEVQLVFEAVSDTFQAHLNRDHLHRLAPERRAPVMKLLARLTT